MMMLRARTRITLGARTVTQTYTVGDPGGTSPTITEIRANGGLDLDTFTNPNVNGQHQLEALQRGALTLTSVSIDPPGTAPAQNFNDSVIQSDADGNGIFLRLSDDALDVGNSALTADAVITVVIAVTDITFLDPGLLYPADRCTWDQTYNPTQTTYEINTATFYDGAGTTTTIENPILGYIGKSGRFVKIAD